MHLLRSNMINDRAAIKVSAEFHDQNEIPSFCDQRNFIVRSLRKEISLVITCERALYKTFGTVKHFSSERKHKIDEQRRNLATLCLSFTH